MTIKDNGHFQDTKVNLSLFAHLDWEKPFQAIPVIRSGHWVLFLLDRPSAKLYILDSLSKICRGRVLWVSSAARIAHKKLNRFLRDMLMQKYNKEFVVTTLSAHVRQKDNNYDCFLHVLSSLQRILEKLSTDSLNLAEWSDGPLLRRKDIRELIWETRCPPTISG